MDHLNEWVLRSIGALAGVMASMVIIAPVNLRNAFYRFIVGLIMGVIFSPAVSQIGWLSFLAGDSAELTIARSAATGFVVWFVLETVARLLSSEKTISLLVDELIKLRGGRS